MKPKSEKVEQFCYEIGFLNAQRVRAYIHSYPNNKYPHQCALQLLQKPYVQERIIYWQQQKAKDIEEKKAKDAARLIITRERQTNEYEKLRKVCMRKKIMDLSTAKGCLDSISKINGLNLEDAPADSEAAWRFTAEQKKISDIIARTYIESKEVEGRQKLLTAGNLASQDAPKPELSLIASDVKESEKCAFR